MEHTPNEKWNRVQVALATFEFATIGIQVIEKANEVILAYLNETEEINEPFRRR